MKRILLAIIRFYRTSVSPLTASHCKYIPTCSQYGIEAIERFGALKGTALTVWRILRCNPFSKGGYDPVPEKKPKRKKLKRGNCMQIFGFLGSLLGYVLWGAFYLLKDFGLSIIVFTIIVRLCMFPFTIKQQKSMAGTARLSKKQKEIQEKYKNNRQKAQEEISKLYEKEGVKPTGGCLTMIVPFLVLFGVFYAVAYPLTNTLHIDSAKVTEALNYVNTIPGYTAASGATNATYQEIYFLKDFSCFQNIDAIQQIFSADQINTITMFEKGFNTFGMNLFAIPQDYGLWSPMILFPVICFASNVLTQFITMRINGKNNPMQQQQGCMKVMMYAMPLFSAYIAYIVPSAVAFYWIVSSLVSLVQSVIVGKLFSPQRMTATSEARHAALMFEQEALVQYNYVPHGLSESAEENTNSKKKKKK